MYLPITATKTYSQWKTENPDFYDDLVSEGLIDEATVSSIDKWFKYRTVCDDVRFTEFFERQLELCLPRYNKLIRLETTEFDALVSVYRERQVIDISTSEGSETASGTRTAVTTDTDGRTTTRTPDLTTTDSGTSSGGSTNSGTSSNSTETTGGTTNENVSVAKQNPQSISYGSGVVAGEIPALDWQYPSAQNQSKSTMEYVNHKVDSTGSTSSTNQTSGTTSNTNVLSGTDETVESGTRSGNQSITDGNSVDRESSSNSTKREIFTGRDGLTPQDALASAMRYVKTSSAFVWLKEQLEVCFLSVYDI